MDMTVQELATIPCAGSHFRRALCVASRHDWPFRHWLLRNVLPLRLATALLCLPFAPARIGETLGKRETHNGLRVFFGEAERRVHAGCAAVAEAFQDEATVGLLEDMTGTRLTGGFLRIEHCMDMDGFWLEPHTDIGAKLFTLLIYLSTHADAADWGTDLMDPEGNVLGRTTGEFDTGMMFVPGPDTWHGFSRRPIRGVRRSLIVNYVKPEWRSRHELAFPDQPVTAAP
ncbi:MAG: 2OG-Fe(II) oxygenase [Acetobacteraceae bacterium]